MLERIALHQTRLRTPGLGLDARGVALGAKGLVLFPSLDRLVAFLAVYTRERSLEDLLGSLEIRLVKSPLGAREITLSFAAESSDRMDRVADVARLAGGFAFTGSMRHFVQYRDASAPFGYDAGELLATEAPLALYHARFTQVYESDKPVDLRALLLRLSPELDPSTLLGEGPRVLVAEPGLGPVLVQYLLRSSVRGEAAVAEWPRPGGLDGEGMTRWIVRVPDVPRRMLPLFSNLPGVRAFLPVAPGVLVEAGCRHPLDLRACPVFEAGGLVFFRRGEAPLVLSRAPTFGDLRTFGKFVLHGEEPARGEPVASPPTLARVPLRLFPSIRPPTNVRATLIPPALLTLLGRIAYALPPRLLREAKAVMTELGLFVFVESGISSLPLGTFLSEVAESLFIPMGFELSPPLSPEVLSSTFDAPRGSVVFLDETGRARAFERAVLVPLETLLVEAPKLFLAGEEAIDASLDLPLPELACGPLPLFPAGELVPPEGEGR